MNEDFKFNNGEWVSVDGALGQVVGTAFFPNEPDAYRVKFGSGLLRWYDEDRISQPRKH